MKLNQGVTPTLFNINDLVLVKNHQLSNATLGETAKLFQIYEGPYRISHILGHSTYFVKNLNNEQEFGPYHVTAMRKYVTLNQDQM